MRRHVVVRVALAALLLSATACSHAGSDPNAFDWSNAMPPGSVLHIRDRAGSVTVHGTAASVAHVAASRAWHRGRARDVNFTVERIGNDFYVCAMWRGSGGNCGPSGYRGPQHASFLTKLSLFHHASDARAEFTVDLPANVGIDASTVTGDVNVSSVASGVLARSTNGSVFASDVAGPVTMRTTNGEIRLQMANTANTDSIHLQAVNGSIHADLPANVEGNFDVSAVNGLVNTNLPLGAHSGHRPHYDGQIGAATRPVYVHVVNGLIAVNRAAGPATTPPALPAPAAATKSVAPLRKLP
jgi:hypothetical protein